MPLGSSSTSRPRWSANLQRFARWGMLCFFLWLAGRFWHPYYGFTKFLQFDSTAEALMLPSLRAAPIHIYRETGGYDGLHYAQIATSPALRDPALKTAIDKLGYRGRRILLGWLAWLVGAGEPAAVVAAYAWLNLPLWFVLAAILWRLFPVGDWRATLAWGGMMFGAGTLLSVRFGLTDLAALALLALAVWWLEHRRFRAGIAWLALAGLARETAVLGVVALLPGKGAGAREWGRVSGRVCLAILPLAVWLAYLHLVASRPEPGLRNFAWPAMGFVERWCEILIGFRLEPDRWVVLCSLLSQVALTAQLTFLLVRRQRDDVWWRAGAAYAVLMLWLGSAVWEGFPGASTRVLLPMTLAFNVLVVRARAGAGWLVLGNLAVCGGLLALWTVPRNSHELTSRSTWHHTYVLETDARWFGTESQEDSHWAWCPKSGGLIVRFWPLQERVRVKLLLRSAGPRQFEIRHAGRVVWQGILGLTLDWIELPELPARDGRVELELSSAAPPTMEGQGPDARPLGFVCYGVRLE